MSTLARSAYLFLAASALVLIILVPTHAAPQEAVADSDPDILPVVVSGDLLAPYQGLPTDDIYVYAYRDGDWEQIPFQIDEKAVDEEDQRVYAAVGDGLLDADEELVFMLHDMGAEAPADAWVDSAADDQRIEVEMVVGDETRWAYVFTGPELTRTFTADYVRFSGPAQRIIAERYEVGFLDNSFGVDELRLNNSGVDVLDRSKLRLHIVARVFGFPVLSRTCTEDSITVSIDAGGCGQEPRPTAPVIDGPVRLVTGPDGGFAYGGLFQLADDVDLSDLTVPVPGATVAIENVRFSFDFAAQAVATDTPTLYFDANLDQPVEIDGEPDAVPAEPLAVWRQVSHPTGTLVMTADLTSDELNPTNYYLDDDTVDSDDTGDQRSYGDTGFSVEDPAGSFSLTTSLLVLAPTTDAVGDEYAALLDDAPVPLVTRQFPPAEIRGIIYLPFIRR